MADDGKITAPVAQDYLRRQVYKLMTLPYHVRLQMAKDLWLVQAGENGLPSQDLNELICSRIATRGQTAIQGLWRRVDLETATLERYRGG